MTETITVHEVTKKEHDYVLGTYPRLPFVLERGDGVYLTDTDGNRYLDFGSGIAVNALGHSHPAVVRAIQQQAETLSHVCNLYHTAPHAELAEKLCQLSFADKVFFSNSGAEAVETSLKFARKYALQNFGEGKSKLVGFSQGFHGRTFGALSVTAREKYQAPFRPLLQDVAIAEFNHVESARKAIDDTTCAVIVELVQGEGGVHLAEKDFLQELRFLCDQHNALLIVDEVQTGCGRTGTLWAYQQYSIQPDIMAVAKALGGGLPIGATLLTNKVAGAISPGDHGSTFGGGPIASRAALAVLDHLTGEGFLFHVSEIGEYLHTELEALDLPQIERVRSLGLMVGLEMNAESSALYNKAHDYGILILTAGPNVVRLLPPLIITKAEVNLFIAAFKQLIQEQTK